MKPAKSKKMQLGVIKIAPLNQNGAVAQALSNSSCSRVCMTICSFHCTDTL
ncbi:hypothetical protein ACE38W_15300 [Chitinophaga sp. Hz27]|uniref:hypothetical protein n=1 Tax=Chitinophaga sp. Hz27 TaxID=3347169 RepID=UPI0035D75DEA